MNTRVLCTAVDLETLTVTMAPRESAVLQSQMLLESATQKQRQLFEVLEPLETIYANTRSRSRTTSQSTQAKPPGKALESARNAYFQQTELVRVLQAAYTKQDLQQRLQDQLYEDQGTPTPGSPAQVIAPRSASKVGIAGLREAYVTGLEKMSLSPDKNTITLHQMLDDANANAKQHSAALEANARSAAEQARLEHPSEAECNAAVANALATSAAAIGASKFTDQLQRAGTQSLLAMTTEAEETQTEEPEVQDSDEDVPRAKKTKKASKKTAREVRAAENKQGGDRMKKAKKMTLEMVDEQATLAEIEPEVSEEAKRIIAERKKDKSKKRGRPVR